MIALDPGDERTALCEFKRSEREWGPETLFGTRMYNNYDLLKVLPTVKDQVLAVEMIASYGMPVGKEIFETCVWIGRFIQAHGGKWRFVYRKDVKMHLCGNTQAKDSNIKQALINKFGAPGTKRAPGRTYGIRGDEWAALGVALTAFETQPTIGQLEEMKRWHAT